MTFVFTQTICKSTQKFKNPSGKLWVVFFFFSFNFSKYWIVSFQPLGGKTTQFLTSRWSFIHQASYTQFKNPSLRFVQTTGLSQEVQVAKQRAAAPYAVHPSVQNCRDGVGTPGGHPRRERTLCPGPRVAAITGTNRPWFKLIETLSYYSFSRSNSSARLENSRK